jgi:hypothetical protein
MHRRWELVLLLGTGLLAGCAGGEAARTTAWRNRLRPPQGPPPSNLVLMEVALIEQPVGDPYVNQQLWDLADEQVVSLERKPVLQDNGLRIGLMSGMLPPGLQALLTSKRSCANPRRIQRAAGEPTTLMLGLTMPRCRFQLHTSGTTEVVELEQAQCTLIVTASLTTDGRTRLQLTPQVRHGEAALIPRPAVDRAGTYSWMIQEQRPTETYTDLGWEVSLAPNEYLVVGGRLDRPDTLGRQFFVRGDEPSPVQRLLVIRTTRLRPGIAAEDEELLHRTPALAAQALLSNAAP